jgi:hypothetical protein
MPQSLLFTLLSTMGYQLLYYITRATIKREEERMLGVDQRKLIGLLIIGGALGLIAVIAQPSLQEVGGMLAGVAIGGLLVYGHQR